MRAHVLTSFGEFRKKTGEIAVVSLQRRDAASIQIAPKLGEIGLVGVQGVARQATLQL